MTESTSGAVAAPVTSENFELWIRMATDNKINTTNSWNFALIDYFHDMSLFREGDSINFQKASSTLDGCVKIYSSRIDSAASETGRLLSGLSSSEFSNERRREGGNGEEDQGEEEEGDYEDEAARRRAQQRKSRRARLKNTLAKEFDQIKLKDVEKELLANPIFKKALSDFDEGGYRSLLMNMLRMSKDGRVMFVVTEKSEDSVPNCVSNDAEEGKLEGIEDLPKADAEGNSDEDDSKVQSTDDVMHEVDPKGTEIQNAPINIGTLAHLVSGIAPDSKVCPSLDPLESVTDGNSSATYILDQLGQIEYADPVENEDNKFDMNGGYDDVDPAAESSNISKQNRSQYSLYLDEGMDEEDSTFKSLNLTRLFDENGPAPIDNEEDEEGGLEMARYFDSMSNRNWRGPEYWKISRVKSQFTNEHKVEQPSISRGPSAELKVPPKKNAPLSLNFLDDGEDVDESILFRPGNASKLMVSQRQMEAQQGFNCLPEDLQFTTKRLICLNLKPEQRLNTILTKKKKRLAMVSRDEPNMVADESFFADVYEEGAKQGTTGDNFFDDDPADFGDELQDNVALSDNDEPANDIDQFEAPVVPSDSPPLQAILSQSKKHNEALSYARTSKRVDVRLLKQQLWTTLEERIHKKRDSSYLEEDKENIGTSSPQKSQVSNVAEMGDSQLRFSDVVSQMSDKYEGQAKKDLSTSFCFICMLHLANENGLMLEGTPDNRDLIIRK
ncbi:DEKNAAC101751 [Brettanomyces naardenensis]|uniref:Condensin complex subunit 2 n=1 Tax=Brettanomyces naardenensis TaxID=13370 RepID=A0A448YJ08_BRENA|nr:DEKNAAC101751 [Brettanomyces naardenensis]